MAQSSFAYQAPASHGAPRLLGASILADRAALRAELAEDAAAAGLVVGFTGDLAGLLEGEARPLGEVVLLDCPQVKADVLAALAQLDMRAAQAGAQLVVSTTMAALDEVFGCLDQSGAQILVDPSRAERVLALGQALMRLPDGRVRDLSEADRLALLRLTEQVGQIAERLDRLDASRSGAGLDGPDEDSAFRFESPRPAFKGAGGDDSGDRLIGAARPRLPDPRLVRGIIRQRQLRARFLDGELFADPAWDILLDLTAARAEQCRVSVSSLCIASAVPPTTALRWIGQMTHAGLLERIEDQADRRRAFITLSDTAAEAMARYFAALSPRSVRVI